MATGVNPAKVGIFGLRHRQPDSYRLAPPTSATRKAAAMWEMANQAGKQAIVVNVPDTYPPSSINGAMISGRPAPVDPAADITYPPDLRAQLEQAVGRYLVGPSADYDDTSQSDELEAWASVMQSQQKALDYLLEGQDWDLVLYVSMAIDGSSHHFWKHTDPQHPDHDPATAVQFGDTMRQIYQMEDERIGQIMKHLRPDDLLLIVSDHGSTPCYRHIAVNLWLIEQGYLVLKTQPKSGTGSLLSPFIQSIMQLYRNSDAIRHFARRFKDTALRDAVVTTHFRQKTGGRIPFDALDIDWGRTSAYYLGDDRLYINLAGREPQGRIQPGVEYENLRSQLIADLMACTEPESGKTLFAAVHRREEIYRGPYMDQAPDLILVPGDDHWSLGGAVGAQVIDRPVVSGKHHPEGVFVAWGAGVLPGIETSASIYDIAPTVLHVLGLPIPENSDGMVQLSWFRSDSATSLRPIQIKVTSKRDTAVYELSDHEKAQIEAQLRNLGYLD